MYDDFYNEPSEFEMQIDEFKQSLIDSVRDDFKKEMERLRTENAKLQEVKKNFLQIESDYKNKERQLETEREEMKKNVKRERLDQLMGDAKVMMYSPEYYEFETRKCDRCNEKRQIEYITPLGKEAMEHCTCNHKLKLWVPAENVLHKLSFNHNNQMKWAYYSIKNDKDYDSLEHRSDSAANTFIPNLTTYEEVEKNW